MQTWDPTGGRQASNCLHHIATLVVFIHLLKVVHNKENLERQETNKYGRGTEQHLPKTDESVVEHMGERR